MADTPQTIEAVALALLNRVVDAERNSTSVPPNRAYFLSLYRECLGAVQHPLKPADATTEPDAKDGATGT